MSEPVTLRREMLHIRTEVRDATTNYGWDSTYTFIEGRANIGLSHDVYSAIREELDS